MSETDIPDRLQVVVRPAADDERWAFRSEYVEFVWSEALGPTALLLARRLGTLIERSPRGAELSVAELAHELGVGVRKIDSSLGRLARNGLVSYSREQGVVGASGFARRVGERGRSALSRRGAEIDERLAAKAGGESWVERRARRVERLGESLAGRRSGPAVSSGGQGR